ncbi:MAG: C-type lectin domain-containing protein [Hyphomicrobiaceae bacterium]
MRIETIFAGSAMMNRSTSVLFLLLLLWFPKSAISEDSEQDRYFVGSQRLTWTAARAYCQARGADLVTIESPEENEIAGKLVRQKSTNPAGCWIGATNTGIDGQWRWINGTEVHPFSNWKRGEPNSWCGGEHYAHMYPDGTWNDQKIDGGCNNYGLMQPICERNERRVSMR